MMKILGAINALEVSFLEIVCSCGEKFRHKTDRRKITCPECGYRESMRALRHRYVRENYAGDGSLL